MGFYIKDLYIHRVPKFQWHDKLTNPPTVPETSPVIQAAALSPHLGAVVHAGQGGGGEAGLPADDTTLYTVPTPITPIILPGRLEETDLQLVRENLVATLRVVESQLEQMKPSAEDVEYVSSVVRG